MTLFHIAFTLVFAANIWDSWRLLWKVPIQHKKELRYACFRLVFWSMITGMALCMWLVGEW